MNTIQNSNAIYGVLFWIVTRYARARARSTSRKPWTMEMQTASIRQIQMLLRLHCTANSAVKSSPTCPRWLRVYKRQTTGWPISWGTWVGLTFIWDTPPSCPAAQPVPPISPSAQAEPGRGWNGQNQSQPNRRLPGDGSPCRDDRTCWSCLNPKNLSLISSHLPPGSLSSLCDLSHIRHESLVRVPCSKARE